VTIGVEFGSRIVPVGPPASLEYNINNPAQAAAIPTPEPAGDAKSKSKNKAAPPKPKTPEQKHMKLSLWDTAGQETYKSITRSYFRGASGALLVFDISRRNTFASVTAWLNDLRQIAEDDIVVVLVGNKSDLAASSTVSGDTSAPNKRQVTREEAEEWCKENKVMQYVETSAKSGENVERAFLEVAERIYQVCLSRSETLKTRRDVVLEADTAQQNIEAGKYDLNDRRSGVKGPGAGGGRGVTLGGPDRNAAKKSGCC
jgi:small GTP-binding protein